MFSILLIKKSTRATRTRNNKQCLQLVEKSVCAANENQQSKMKGPASLAIERLKISKAAEEILTMASPTMIQEDTFDMSLLKEAAAACAVEPFPKIPCKLESKDGQAERFAHHSSPQQRKKVFFMSPQARRLKRRRRGSCDGYLVRCSEVFESLLRINGGTSIEDDEYQRSVVNRQQRSTTRSSKKTKREDSNDLNESAEICSDWGLYENNPESFP